MSGVFATFRNILAKIDFILELVEQVFNYFRTYDLVTVMFAIRSIQNENNGVIWCCKNTFTLAFGFT
ncbi:hypothetical protein OM33_08965 [Pseudoalteromonas piratica]|uniref:Uncharacterized protein n=1 Tax=Pseudoalteromonas piratica TaxID=1348114 RepID=A0A0A7EH12_9GAMM|nr:hypothetical protein OM33_08965 [Pseudoalteromonas piratica]